MDHQRRYTRKRKLRTVFLVAILSACLAPTTAGQEVQLIEGGPVCSDCGIRLEHLVTLGDREGSGRVMRPHAIVQDSHGNYLIAHGDGSGAAKRIWVFAPDGAFIRTLGREGEGPGEFKGIGRIDVLSADTLVVYDRILRRRTTFSPEFVPVETQPYEVGNFFNSALLGDGQMVVNQHFRTPDRVGYPLQLLDRRGDISRSFGTISPDYRPREPVKLNRLVVSGPDGGSVWSIGRGDYLMELWDTTGERRAAFQRETDWFVPFVADGGITPTGPPPPTWIRLVRKQGKEKLLVLATVPKDNWREIAAETPNLTQNITALFGLYDWVFELVDLSRGEVAVSQVFQDMEFVSFLGEDGIVSYREDGSGYPFLELWKVVIETAPPTPTSDGGKR